MLPKVLQTRYGLKASGRRYREQEEVWGDREGRNVGAPNTNP